jgi:hypothetical protein
MADLCVPAAASGQVPARPWLAGVSMVLSAGDLAVVLLARLVLFWGGIGQAAERNLSSSVWPDQLRSNVQQPDAGRSMVDGPGPPAALMSGGLDELSAALRVPHHSWRRGVGCNLDRSAGRCEPDDLASVVMAAIRLRGSRGHQSMPGSS